MAFCVLASTAKAQSPPLDPRIARCAEVADDITRLRCYDAEARPRPSPGAIQVLPAQTPANQTPAQPASPTLRRGPGVRLDGGYGFSVGDYVGTIGVSNQGKLKINSETGGAGGGVMAEVWLDDWPWRNIAIGAEYIRVFNQGAVSATLPKGLSILTDPVYAHVGLEVAADVGMLNIAYRPHGFGWLRPVIGVGVGGGSGYAAESDVFANPFLGQSIGGTRSRSPFPMVQAFAGVDAELPRRVYLSLTGRLMAINGHPIGIDQSYTDLVIATTVGYRFR